jgi:hypothetical protein
MTAYLLGKPAKMENLSLELSLLEIYLGQVSG